jgi:hypothetical protein
LATPITNLLDMDWAEVCAWHEEAARIAKANIGR